MSAVKGRQVSQDLREAAKQISAAHRAVQQAQDTWLDRVRKTGDLLIGAKKAVKGAGEQWEPWPAEHCQIDLRQAQRYMLVAKHFAKLEKLDVDWSDMSLRRAEKLLKDSKDTAPVPPVPPEPLEVAAADLEAARADPARRPKLRPGTRERQFVDAEVDRIHRRAIGLVRRSQLKVDRKPAPLAAVAAALIEAIKSGVTLEKVVRATSASDAGATAEEKGDGAGADE